MPNYLVIDQGTQSTRIYVFDQFGHVLEQKHIPVKINHPAPSIYEQDADEILRSIQQSMNTNSVQSAALVTQRSSVVAWHKTKKKALTPVVSWMDRRAHRLLNSLPFSSVELSEKTGLVKSPHYGASKMRWLLQHHAFDDISQTLIGPLSSYLSHCLTDSEQAFADPANGGRTMLRNINTQDWDEELLSAFALSRESLPLCCNHVHDFGLLKKPFNNIPLTLVNGDQNAALFAQGWLDHKYIYVNVGTGAFATRPSSTKLEHGFPLLQSILYKDHQWFYTGLEGTVNGAGLAINQFTPQQDVRAVLSKEHSCVFLNGVGGLGSPFWQTDFPSYFLNDDQPWHRAAAIIESIVFLLYENIDLIDQKTHELLDHYQNVYITGGLSQNNHLCQCLADLTAREVRRHQDVEATARGAAFLLSQNDHWNRVKTDSFLPNINHPLNNRFMIWKQHMQQELHRLKQGNSDA